MQPPAVLARRAVSRVLAVPGRVLEHLPHQARPPGGGRAFSDASGAPTAATLAGRRRLAARDANARRAALCVQPLDCFLVPAGMPGLVAPGGLGNLVSSLAGARRTRPATDAAGAGVRRQGWRRCGFGFPLPLAVLGFPRRQRRGVVAGQVAGKPRRHGATEGQRTMPAGPTVART